RRSRQERAASRSGRQTRPRRRCGCCTCGLCPFGLATGVSRGAFFYDTRKTSVPDGRRASRCIGPLPTRNRVLSAPGPGRHAATRASFPYPALPVTGPPIQGTLQTVKRLLLRLRPSEDQHLLGVPDRLPKVEPHRVQRGISRRVRLRRAYRLPALVVRHAPHLPPRLLPLAGTRIRQKGTKSRRNGGHDHLSVSVSQFSGIAVHASSGAP